MPILINRSRLHDYVLEAERELPKEEQSVFKLRVLDPERASVVRERLIPYVGTLGAAAAATAPEEGEDAEQAQARHTAAGEKVLEAMEAGKFSLVEFARDTIETCADGIGGWEHVCDEDGKDVALELDAEGRVRRDLLLMFSGEDIQELAIATFQLNTVSRAERGK